MENMKDKSKRQATAYWENDASARVSHRADEKSMMWSAKTMKDIMTVNIRSLYKTGKFGLLQENLKHVKWDILGLSETHWTEEGVLRTQEGKIYFSGRKDGIHREGVAIMIKEELIHNIVEVNPISSRIIAIRLKGKEKGLHIKIIEVYAPDGSHKEEDVDLFYSDLQKEIDSTHRRDMLIVMGDFNSKVGQFTDENKDVMGKFGIGIQNERGETLIQFCKINNLIIANTLFYHHHQHKTTWTSPDGNIKNCIDYILIRKNWKTSINNVKTLKSIDLDTDHNLLSSKIKIRFKENKKTSGFGKLNIEELHNKSVANIYRILLEDRLNILDLTNVEQIWKEGKEIILKAARETLGKQVRPNNEWITPEILRKCEEKRQIKILLDTDNAQEKRQYYRKLKNEIDSMCRMAKEDWLNNKAEECQRAYECNNSKVIFKTIKDISRDYTSVPLTMRDSQGRETGNHEVIKDIWFEYYSHIFKGESDTNSITEDLIVDEHLEVTYEEVKNAIQYTLYNKAPGIDEIPNELWREGEDVIINFLRVLFTEILQTGEIPEDWRTGVIIPIFKKGDKKVCNNYRPINLLSHAYKIFMKVIQNRIKGTYEELISEEQAGFRKDHSTIDQIFTLQQVSELSWENNRDLYCYFVDFRQAFDSINRGKLIEILKTKPIDKEIINFLIRYYADTRAIIKKGNMTTKEIGIKKGVMQGCPVSPILFNLYLEEVINLAFEKEEGININGYNLTHIKYADDIVIFADTKANLENLIYRLHDTCLNFDMEINMGKTKVMKIGRIKEEVNIEIQGHSIEQVEIFVYLGSLFTERLDIMDTIKHRISIGWSSMNKLRRIWKNNKLSKELKVKLYNTMIIPTVTYGAETWTLKKKEKEKLMAFEMKCLRRINGTKWTERKTNEGVRKELDITDTIEDKISLKQLRWFGHVVRMNPSRLPYITLYSIVGGNRPRGRPRTKWIEAVRRNSKFTTYRQLTLAARDREYWRFYIHGGLNPSQTEEN